MRALLIALAAVFVLAAPASAASPDLVISRGRYGGSGNDAARVPRDCNERHRRSAINLDPYAAAGASTAPNGRQLPGRRPAPTGTSRRGGTSSSRRRPAPRPTATVRRPIATAPDRHDGDAGKALVTEPPPTCDGARIPRPGGAASRTSSRARHATADSAAHDPASTSRECRDGCDTDDNPADFDALAHPAPRNSGTPRGIRAADAAPSWPTDARDGAARRAARRERRRSRSASRRVDRRRSRSRARAAAPTRRRVTRRSDRVHARPGHRLRAQRDLHGHRAAAGVSDRTRTIRRTAGADFTFSFTTLGLDAAHPRHPGRRARVAVRRTAWSRSSPASSPRVRNNGFWMQDPQPDANPATSEGIFVFTSARAPTVAVGTAVTRQRPRHRVPAGAARRATT